VDTDWLEVPAAFTRTQASVLKQASLLRTSNQLVAIRDRWLVLKLFPPDDPVSGFAGLRASKEIHQRGIRQRHLPYVGFALTLLVSRFPIDLGCSLC